MKRRLPEFRSVQPTRVFPVSAILTLLIACTAGPAWAAAEIETWAVSDLRTSFAFHHDLLEGIGLAVKDIDATGAPLDHHETSVSAGRDFVFAGVISPSLDLRVIEHVPQRFDGMVLHRGGFRLVGSAGNISFSPFSLRSGVEPRTLEVLSADGEVIFYADHMHFSLERGLGRLRSFNLDLRLAPALTERLDAPAMTGAFVGTLALEARFAPREEDPVPGGCVPDWSGDVDVRLTSINNVDQVVESGGLVGIAPSAELKNVGTADVPWWQKFTGPNAPFDNDQHPFLVWALYRMKDDSFEQLAVSDVKHAFLTLNYNCTPDSEGCDSHVLGLGCEDIYGSGTNDSRSHLSYRDELESSVALWSSTGSHFDPDDDGVQEHPPQNSDGTFDHRLLVKEGELEDSEASYYMGAFYIIRDDIDIFNSMAYRKITPTDFGSFWSFPTSGGTINGSALDVWVDPISPPAGTSNSTIVDSGGHIQLAARATTQSSGAVRFEYALMNHDFDQQLSAFTVPLNGEMVFNVTFKDLDDDPTNDWQASVEKGQLVWRMPGDASGSDVHTGGVGLDWGLMFNFGFTVFGGDTVMGRTQVQPLGVIGTKRIEAVAPAGNSGLIFFDDFEAGNTSAWAESTP